MNDSDKSISQLLEDAGFGHRKGANQNYKHTIYRLDNGEVVGDMSAHEAVEFLETLRTAQVLEDFAACVEVSV